MLFILKQDIPRPINELHETLISGGTELRNLPLKLYEISFMHTVKSVLTPCDQDAKLALSW